MTAAGVSEYIDSLNPSDFYADRHGFIFEKIKELYSRGLAHDVEVIADVIRKSNRPDLDDRYLFEIYSNSNGSIHNLSTYIETVRDYARRRALFAAGERIKIIASDTTQYDVISAVAQSESILSSLETNDDSDTLDDAFNISVDLFAHIDEVMTARREGREVINGVKTGLAALDNQIGVIQNTDLVIIGARPSMGKTAMAQTMMLDIAFLQQKSVLFQSAEMSKKQIGARLVSAISNIPLGDIVGSKIKDEDWEKFNKATQKLRETKLMVDDKSSPTITDIRRNCRKLKQKYGSVGAVFVDYLTLIKSPLQTDNMHQATGAITKALKGIAKEFDCPVFCLSQLSRRVEERKDKRPMSSDLRESGSIEEDANIILFLYRDEYYNKATQDHGVAEVIASKVRDGEVGTVKLSFEGRYSRFSDLDYFEV